MNWKKKIMAVLLTVLVSAAAVAGILWNREHYVLVDFRFYPRTEATLDLRGQELPVARFEKLQKKLPDCEILWDLPLSGIGVYTNVSGIRQNNHSFLGSN